MRTFLRAASFALALFALPASAAIAQQAAAPKLAYVDSRAVLQQAPGWAAAETAFQNEMTTYQQQMQRMGDSLNTMIAEYDRQAATLSPAAKEAREKQIRDRQAEYEQRARQLEQQMQQRRMELAKPIMDRINAVIEEIRAEGNYAFIFDVGAQAGAIIAADKNLDLTQRVVTRLQQTAGRPQQGSARPTGAAMPAPAGVSRPTTPPTR